MQDILTLRFKLNLGTKPFCSQHAKVTTRIVKSFKLAGT